MKSQIFSVACSPSMTFLLMMKPAARACCGIFISVMLKRHCQDYKDGNSQYFTENLVTDYMLVTYSRDGKILDFKTVGHDGSAYFTRITPNEQALNFLVEQGALDDCTSILRYQDLTYTV